MGVHRRTRDILPLWRKLLALCAAVLAIAMLIAWALSLTSAPRATVPTPQAEVAVVTPSVSPSVPSPSPSATLTPAPQVALGGLPAAAVPLTITAPTLGFNQTPLATMQTGAPGTEVTPPIDTQNPINSFKPYWIENFGMPGAGASDTVYIIGHACTAQCEPSMLPFNRLVDMKLGDIISLTTKTGEVTYRVTRSVTYDQEAPASEKGGTWDRQPGQLVLVSCNPSNFHGKSTSVFAELVEK